MKNNYKIKKLGEICNIELGKTPYRGDRSFWDIEKKTNNVWLSIADLLNIENNIITDSKEYITNKAAKICKIVKKNSLLLSFKLTLGRMAFAGIDLFTNEAIAALEIKNEKEVCKYYLYYYFLFFDWNKATDQDVKVKGRTLNKSKLREIQIPLPPLLTQLKIVKTLDEAFEKIKKAKDIAEQNLKNSKEVFESYLQNVFEKKGEGWENKNLRDIAEYFNGLTYSPKDVKQKGIIVLRSSNVQEDLLDFSDLVRVDCDVKEKIIVKDGDILMCSRNGSQRLVGKTARIKNLPEKMTFGTFMMIIRSDYNFYLSWFFKSKVFKKQIIKGENTMINQITRYMLDEIYIPFPKSLTEQKQIVKKLDELREEMKKMEEIYKKKIKDLEELKKSLLEKAFNGEL